MSEFYYVIVDLENLTYMQNGNPCEIKEADKFETYEDAKKELNQYDKDANCAIYKIKETTTRTIKLISTQKGDIEKV